MKIIDLARPIQHNTINDPPIQPTRIEYIDHHDGALEMLEFFPGATLDDLPGREGWAIDKLYLCSHSGTHMDAPYHYHSTMDCGKQAYTIDHVPLEWCIGRGVKLDFSDRPHGELISSEAIDEKLRQVGHDLMPGDIVLIQSGAAPYWDTGMYMQKGVGIGREATLYLTGRGIRVTGTDAWSWDRPLSRIADDFAQSGDSSVIWEGHYAGMIRAYCHMEKMANLSLLPATGFTVVAFPVKISDATAGWVRPVALIDS